MLDKAKVKDQISNDFSEFIEQTTPIIPPKASKCHIFSFPLNVQLIFLNEVTERFAYYGNRAILTLFLTSMHIDEAVLVFSFFSAFAYTMPMFGSYLADAHFGRFSIILSFSCIYCIGAFLLAFAAEPKFWDSVNYPVFIYLSLCLTSIGTGGIKPCVSTFGADQLAIHQNQYNVEQYLQCYVNNIERNINSPSDDTNLLSTCTKTNKHNVSDQNTTQHNSNIIKDEDLTHLSPVDNIPNYESFSSDSQKSSHSPSHSPPPGSLSPSTSFTTSPLREDEENTNCNIDNVPLLQQPISTSLSEPISNTNFRESVQITPLSTESFFFLFYLTMNIGSTLATLIVPIIRTQISYFWAFIIPAILMFISILCLCVGRLGNMFYLAPPDGSVLITIFVMIKRALFRYKYHNKLFIVPLHLTGGKTAAISSHNSILSTLQLASLSKTKKEVSVSLKVMSSHFIALNVHQFVRYVHSNYAAIIHYLNAECPNDVIEYQLPTWHVATPTCPYDPQQQQSISLQETLTHTTIPSSAPTASSSTAATAAIVTTSSPSISSLQSQPQTPSNNKILFASPPPPNLNILRYISQPCSGDCNCGCICPQIIRYNKQQQEQQDLLYSNNTKSTIPPPHKLAFSSLSSSPTEHLQTTNDNKKQLQASCCNSGDNNRNQTNINNDIKTTEHHDDSVQDTNLNYRLELTHDLSPLSTPLSSHSVKILNSIPNNPSLCACSSSSSSVSPSLSTITSTTTDGIPIMEMYPSLFEDEPVMKSTHSSHSSFSSVSSIFCCIRRLPYFTSYNELLPSCNLSVDEYTVLDYITKQSPLKQYVFLTDLNLPEYWKQYESKHIVAYSPLDQAVDIIQQHCSTTATKISSSIKESLKTLDIKYWAKNSKPYLEKTTFSSLKYSVKAQTVQNFRIVIILLPVFANLPLFWSLMNQQGSTWMIQAQEMDLNISIFNLFTLHIDPEQMSLLNPIFLFILLPTFELIMRLFKNIRETTNNSHQSSNPNEMIPTSITNNNGNDDDNDNDNIKYEKLRDNDNDNDNDDSSADDTLLQNNKTVKNNATDNNKNIIHTSQGSSSLSVFTSFALWLTPLNKMILGMFSASIAYIFATFVDYLLLHNKPQSVTILWQVPQYFFITVAESLIAVTGLYAVFEMAPNNMKSLVNALFLFSSALGDVITGIMSGIFDACGLSRQYIFICCAIGIVVNSFFVHVTQHIFGKMYKY